MPEEKKDQKIISAEERALEITQNAKKEAANIIEKAEKKAKAIIEKAISENENFESISKFRKEMILKVAHSAGAFKENNGAAIAIKILAVADQVIALLKEGK